jgi:hypothetical protein
MAHKPRYTKSEIERRIREASAILQALGMPLEQQNDRSALTLLALLDLKPTTPWMRADNPLVGITPMMEFFKAHYARKYAPNSRETVRRFTVHQFEQAGLVIKNPDKPRAVNSPDNVYQIAPDALNLLRSHGSPQWDLNIQSFAATRGKLRDQYAAERRMNLIPVTLPDGRGIQLSPGGQNELVKAIIDAFCPRFTPGADVIYIGDAGDKFVVFDRHRLTELGVVIDEHGKMPDVVIHHKTKDWLLLVEAVTSHGPVSAKRHRELKELFKTASAGLVFVTAFTNRRDMAKYLGDLAWETEVWVADAPSHLIHFNGERFLGPYP